MMSNITMMMMRKMRRMTERNAFHLFAKNSRARMNSIVYYFFKSVSLVSRTIGKLEDYFDWNQ